MNEQYIVVTGSLLGGFKIYGPFASVDEAVEWVESKKPLIGNVTVMEVSEPTAF